MVGSDQNIANHRFGMAEQALNTIYLLGQQPDALCGEIIKTLTAKVFTKAPGSAKSIAEDESNESEVPHSPSPAGTMSRSGSQTSMPVEGEAKADDVSAFALAQLVMVVGHVALKHIVYLELVEREFKHRKDQKAKGELQDCTEANETEKAAAKPGDKDGNDLDAVAGNAEDDIGDLIANIRERELLYGEKSLLAVYGPLITAICASPKRYRVSTVIKLSDL